MRNPAHAPTGAPALTGNSILDALAAAGEGLLLEPKERMRLLPRRILFEAGEGVRFLYFPVTGVIGLMQPDARGAMVEIGQVGAEGVAGITALLGGDPSRWRAVVQIAGEAYRVPVSSARASLERGATLHRLVLRLAHARMVQFSQSIICKVSHGAEQQFSRHVLAYADRSAGPLEMTHEHIAEALGWRRQGITEVARSLQERRAIAYSRGRISVLDRAALEACACECYHLVREALVVTAPLAPQQA